MIEDQKQIPRWKKLYTLAIVVAPIINQYQLPFLTFIEYIALAGLVFRLISNSRVKLDRYIVFAIIGLATTIIISTILAFTHADSDMSIANLVLRMVKYVAVAIGIAASSEMMFNYRYGKRLFDKIVILTTVFLYVEYFAYLLSGRMMYGLLPGMTLNYNNGISSTLLMTQNINKILRGYFYRPSSLFIEPAHYALYVMPWIAISLFEMKKINTKKVFLIAIITMGALLTTSALAILGCAIIWFLFIADYIKKSGRQRNGIFYAALILIIASVIVYYALHNNNIVHSLGIKVNSLGSLNETSSATLRLLRGWRYYFEIDLPFKILGVGYGNLTEYYRLSNMNLIYDSSLVEVSYMSGITTILNSFGIVGLVLYLRWLVWMYKNSNSAIRGLILTLGIMLFTSDCYDSASYWMIFALIAAGSSLSQVSYEEER